MEKNGDVMGLLAEVVVGVMGLGLREAAWPDAVLTRTLLKGSQVAAHTGLDPGSHGLASVKRKSQSCCL